MTTYRVLRTHLVCPSGSLWFAVPLLHYTDPERWFFYERSISPRGLHSMPPALKMTQLVSVPLLRYRFDATARMEKHLHEVEGRTLFFYPGAVSHKDGQWVFVAFASGGSCCLFRGRIRTQE